MRPRSNIAQFDVPSHVVDETDFRETVAQYFQARAAHTVARGAACRMCTHRRIMIHRDSSCDASALPQMNMARVVVADISSVGPVSVAVTFYAIFPDEASAQPFVTAFQSACSRCHALRCLHCAGRGMRAAAAMRAAMR